jgi:hypothetical protein
MNKVVSSENVYVSNSKIANGGRGVFAKCDIAKGNVIESCPMIEISEDDTANSANNILVTYFFYFGKKKERSAIALGFGSIYNHSYTPNAKFIIKEEEKIINFVALTNIKRDGEITFNYLNSKGNKTPLWFEV